MPQMRQIDLVPYNFDHGLGMPVELVIVREWLVKVLVHQSLNLPGLELLERNDLRLKIKACQDDELLLDEAEWKKLKDACDKVRGFPEQFIELFERVRDAPKVDVEKKAN